MWRRVDFNWRFEGTYRLHLQARAHAGLSLADFLYPEDGGDTFSETSVSKISTRRHTPEDGLLHSLRRENPKSYNLVVEWSVCNFPIECDL
jgi:hypothetical protein